MFKTGLVHVYYGYGQGKTSAAAGLSIRALGCGCTVLFVQFLKNGRSGELNTLRGLGGGIGVVAGPPCKFTVDMNEAEREQAAKEQHDVFIAVKERIASERVDLLVLDEVLDTVELGMIGGEELLDFLRMKPAGLEIVMTGHKTFPGLCDIADYVSEIVKIKHPYDRGIGARKGAEY